MIKAIVTDIEGTTSSLSFVKDILFPYASKNIEDYVRQHAADNNVATILKDVSAEIGKTLNLEETISQLKQWIEQDKKITPLKSLQGLLWEAGYKNGDFKGHIYEDAFQQLKHWHDKGIKLYVYSSGSVYAQKLLFGHTEHGDLNYLFSGYFDTTIGAKIDVESYNKIVDQLNINADEILFLSDIEAELDAASNANMNTIWLVRDKEINSKASHQQVPDFISIDL